MWLLFGAIARPIMIDRVDLTTVTYALLSLTLVRMVPVALTSLGSGLDRRTVLFIGWFGPRGLASLVFALLALELGTDADEALTVIGLTVLLSVLAHGLSASPLATSAIDDHTVDPPIVTLSKVCSSPVRNSSSSAGSFSPSGTAESQPRSMSPSSSRYVDCAPAPAGGLATSGKPTSSANAVAWPGLRRARAGHTGCRRPASSPSSATCRGR